MSGTQGAGNSRTRRDRSRALARRIAAAIWLEDTRDGLVCLTLLALVVTAVAGLLVGGVVYRAQATVGAVEADTGPATAAAEEARASLAAADQAVVDSFRSGTARLAGPGQRYQDGITNANQALTELTEHYAGNVEATQQLQFLNAMLVTYMGLVGQADTAYRLAGATDASYDLGVIYLWQASKLLYDPAGGILALIDTLNEPVEDELDDQSSAWSLRPVAVGVVVVSSIVLLGALVLLQVFLAQRFKRMFNPLLLVATACMAVLGLWATVVTLGNNRDYREAREAHELLVDAWQDRADTASAESTAGMTELLEAPCSGEASCAARVSRSLMALEPTDGEAIEPLVATETSSDASDAADAVGGDAEEDPERVALTAYTAHIGAASDATGLEGGVPAVIIAVAGLTVFGVKPRFDEFGSRKS